MLAAAVLIAAGLLLLSGCAETGGTAVVATLAPAAEAPPDGLATAPVSSAPPATVMPSVAPTPTPPAPLAATVNGHYIFLADYERRVAQYQQALVGQGLDPSSEDGQARLATMRQEVFDSLVNYVLIQDRAAELGITVTDEQIEAQVEKDIEAGGGQAAFDEWLQATGQNRDDYKQSLREAILWQQVMDSVSSSVPASAEQVHVRHIIVDSQQTSDHVLALLQSGTDFGQVARESSLDVATKDNGGDLGWLPRGLVEPGLENIVFALQPGEIAGPIQDGQIFRFVQVVEREAGRPLSEEMQFDLKRATFERWLEEQRAAAAIERFVNE